MYHALQSTLQCTVRLWVLPGVGTSLGKCSCVPVLSNVIRIVSVELLSLLSIVYHSVLHRLFCSVLHSLLHNALHSVLHRVFRSVLHSLLHNALHSVLHRAFRSVLHSLLHNALRSVLYVQCTIQKKSKSTV